MGWTEPTPIQKKVIPVLAAGRDVAGQAYERLEVLDVAYADIHRNQPFHDSPDFVGALRQLMDTPAFKSMMEPRL